MFLRTPLRALVRTARASAPARAAVLPRAAARPTAPALPHLRPCLAARLLHSSPVVHEQKSSVLDHFVDPYELDPDLPAPGTPTHPAPVSAFASLPQRRLLSLHAGRRWSAAELRLKSNEDLCKLWVVLMRERNMLYSTRMLHRKNKTTMPHPDRLPKVRKSMAMVKVVLGERERALDEAKLEAMQIREQHERDQKVEIAAKTLDGTPT